MSNIVHVTDVNECNDLINNKVCVVKFTATWCPPCKKIAPIFTELSVNSPITFIEIDVDEETTSAITHKENVSGIPLFVFYNKGIKDEELTFSGDDATRLKTNAFLLVKKTFTEPKFTYLVDDDKINSGEDESEDEESDDEDEEEITDEESEDEESEDEDEDEDEDSSVEESVEDINNPTTEETTTEEQVQESTTEEQVQETTEEQVQETIVDTPTN